jgi:signal transduction histidine kinase
VLAERNRIAREFHDSIAQTFVGIRLQVDHHASTGDPQALQRARSMAVDGQQDARRAVAALRPRELMALDFPQAVDQLVAQSCAGLSIDAKVLAPPRWHRLAPDTEDHLFRMVQEAVSNSLRHAKASGLQIEMSQRRVAHNVETLVLVSDNGVGFDVQGQRPTSHFGLRGIQQRAGLIGAVVQMISEPGQGTQLLITVSAQPISSGELSP